MNILYITYIDFGDFSSGSSVRPQKMYDAFISEGHNVKLLECQQNKYLLRNRKVKEIISWLKHNKPDICYIESPSGPIFNMIDYRLIKEIHKRNIPVGMFYRDAFWLFDEHRNKASRIKDYIIKILNLKESRYINKYVDILYMPSQTMIDIVNTKGYFCSKKINPLPPASDRAIDESCKKLCWDKIPTCIYVGGLSDFYGTDLMYDAFKSLNNDKIICNLIVVCRREEFLKYEEVWNDYSWLKIVHASGEELEALYKDASFGIIPIRKTPYSEMAISVKLMEYIGHGLPIVATDLKEMGSFVKANDIGIVSDDTAIGLQEAVSCLLNDNNKLQLYMNVKKANNNNLWISRVRTIIENLTNLYI